MQYVGVPYIYGGKDPALGLDCSGLLWNALGFLGLRKEVLSAQGFFDLYQPRALVVMPTKSNLGDLCFFGTTFRIHHVGIALNDKQMLEAAHGGRNVVTREIAQGLGAKVMVNPISRLPDLYNVLRISDIFS